ncbi:MAG: T9SS type A sorting domain-containing protein [Balneola sp.]
MYRIIVTVILLLLVLGDTQAQQVEANREADKFISYQVGSRMAETTPLKSDLMKSRLAEKLSERGFSGRLKNTSDNPEIGSNFKSFTPHNTGSNGISGSFVRFVFEDREGKLYFSTSGIDRWDGFNWNNVSPVNSELSSFSVHDMIEDRNGNIWLATFNGLVVWHKTTEEFTVLTAEENGLKSNLVLRLYEDKAGKIYAGHRYDLQYEGGVTILNNEGFVERTLSGANGELYGDSIEDFADNGSGKLYIATGSDPNTGEFGGITVWNLNTASIDTFYNKDNSDLPTNEVSSLAVDKDGVLWAGLYTNPGIGNTEGGLVKFDGTTWTHYSPTKGDDTGTIIRDLAVGKDGTIWIAAADGAFMYDGTNFSQLNGDDDGIALVNISSVKELADGRIAFSKFLNPTGEGGGVSFLNPTDDTWSHLSSRDGGVNSAVKFGADYDSQGNLWSTGFYGLQKYDGVKWELWTQKDGLEATYGWDLLVDVNDNVWINSVENGITRINANGTIESVTDFGVFVESNWEARNGDIWFGDYIDDYDGTGNRYSNGMLHFDGTNYTVYDTTDGLPAGEPVTSIAEDAQGRILASTWSGLYRLESGSFTKWEFDGYNGGDVYKLHLDSNDRLWINHGGMTSMFDGTNWSHFGQYDGINGWVEDIEDDISGRVWFAQPDGAAVFENGVFHSVTARNGYIQNGVRNFQTLTYDLAPSRTQANVVAIASFNGGMTVMDSEMPLQISSITDNPNDQGGFLRVNVDGYLLNRNYVGNGAQTWRVEVKHNGKWESANAPVSASSSKGVNVAVAITKATDATADTTNSYEFRVVGIDDEGYIVGMSSSQIGFAEDNIAPSQVESFSAQKVGSDINLTWTGIEDNDLDQYEIYLESVTDFSNNEPLASTRSTSFVLEDSEFQSLVVVGKDIHNNYGVATVVSLLTSNEELADIPDNFEMSQNYPNPFNPSTKISFELPASSFTKLTVYNTLGQQVSVLVNEVKQAGSHDVTFDAGALNSGMYFYRIEAGGFTKTRKMLLIK